MPATPRMSQTSLVALSFGLALLVLAITFASIKRDNEASKVDAKKKRGAERERRRSANDTLAPAHQSTTPDLSRFPPPARVTLVPGTSVESALGRGFVDYRTSVPSMWWSVSHADAMASEAARLTPRDFSAGAIALLHGRSEMKTCRWSKAFLSRTPTVFRAVTRVAGIRRASLLRVASGGSMTFGQCGDTTFKVLLPLLGEGGGEGGEGEPAESRGCTVHVGPYIHTQSHGVPCVAASDVPLTVKNGDRVPVTLLAMEVVAQRPPI